MQSQSKAFGKTGRSRKWLPLTLMFLGVLSIFVFVSTASAAGNSRRITAVAYFADETECDAPVTSAEGNSPDLIQIMTGDDLQGCLYVFVDSFTCSSNGVYVEYGRETYVGSGAPGDNGTFETTYRFVANFPSEEECNTFTNQIRGRCQHPLVAGSGTGDYEGATGKFQLTDNIEEGTADLIGLLHYFDNTR
jgi:hypothetical protein